MYASVGRYEVINPDSVDEIVAYFLLDAGNGTIATVPTGDRAPALGR